MYYFKCTQVTYYSIVRSNLSVSQNRRERSAVLRGGKNKAQPFIRDIVPRNNIGLFNKPTARCTDVLEHSYSAVQKLSNFMGHKIFYIFHKSLEIGHILRHCNIIHPFTPTFSLKKFVPQSTSKFSK